MTQPQYLFVCGCPRSGTTAMMELLNAHPSIALGVERYKRYAKPNAIHHLTKDKFQASTFFEIQPTQTNLNPNHKLWNSKWKNIYRSLTDKFDREDLIVGDKYPYYYHFYREIDRAFDKPKWIFILRNLHQVASSYDARASNRKDSWKSTYDYTYAVKDWNDALTKTWQYLEQGNRNLLICEYENIFYGKICGLYQILDFLNIPFNTQINTYYQTMTKDWKKRFLQPQNLSFDRVKYIDANANWILRDRVLKKYGQTFASF